MPLYNVDFSKKALKYYIRLDRVLRARIDGIIADMEAGHFSDYDIEHMVGEQDTFRLRFGGFRMTYERQDNRFYIFVLKIGPRGDIYK